MRLPRPDMVLIDLDGTLVDSVPDLANCVDATMGELGLPLRGEAAVRKWVGNGVERLVKRALLGRLEGEPDSQLFERALAIFQRCYGESPAARSCLYPGVIDGLDYLRSLGLSMGCVTNKAERFTLPILEAMGIRHYFGVVVSGDTLEEKKPDPEPLRYAARALGADPRRSLMLGDSKSDVTAARAAGFRIVCVSYGYNHGEDIRDSHPDAVIDSLGELPALLEEAA